MSLRELAWRTRHTLALSGALLAAGIGCDASSNTAPATNAGANDDADAPSTGAGGTGGADSHNAHSEAGAATAGLPANVCKVLRDNACLTCHSGEGTGGAPMGLQKPEDFAAEALDGSSVGDKVLARMRDHARPMPPSSTGRGLAPEGDIKVLEAWIADGMPEIEGEVCRQDAATGDGPAWARTGWPADECEYVMTIGAHEKSGTPVAEDPAGFPLPSEETYYHCFYEKVPWGDKPVQALAVRANAETTPDDIALLHHMQLSSLGPKDNPSLLGAPRPTKAGQHNGCANPNGSTIGTWGPGATNPVTVPGDVGVLMPSGKDAYVELQVHYHNPKHLAGRRSRASFDVCVTTKMRPNTAGVHTLGFENSLFSVPFATLGPTFQAPLDNKGKGTGVGVCTAKQRARILSIAPHMHELGRRAKVEILRNDGSVQVIHDSPFSFDHQMSYLFDNLWIEKGEKIRTTCVWDTSKRKIVFGFASQDEMCFNSTLAYPSGALAGGNGDEKGFAGGDLSCAGLGG